MKNLGLEEITKEAGRIEESAIYAAETQFEYAKRWRRTDRMLAGIAAGAAAIAGIGVLSDVIGATAAGVIAIVSAGIGAVAAALNAPQTKEKASGSANAYRALQQDARIFRTIDIGTMNQDDARDTLKKLVDRLQELNTTSEIPSDRAWRKAKSQIESGSQDYKADS